jgi:hypothetical protein
MKARSGGFTIAKYGGSGVKTGGVDTPPKKCYAHGAALVDHRRYYEGFVLAKKVDKADEAPDPFMGLLQASLEELLKFPLDRSEKDAVKERNASISNGIRFIMVRNKINGTGDDDGFWGN